MPDIEPDHPRDAGVDERIPDEDHIEGAELLANEARSQLRPLGFTDDEIDEWARTYIAAEGSGDVDSLLSWIRQKEGVSDGG